MAKYVVTYNENQRNTFDYPIIEGRNAKEALKKAFGKDYEKLTGKYTSEATITLVNHDDNRRFQELFFREANTLNNLMKMHENMAEHYKNSTQKILDDMELNLRVKHSITFKEYPSGVVGYDFQLEDGRRGKLTKNNSGYDLTIENN